MRRLIVGILIVVAVLSSVPVWAQDAPTPATRKALNPKLAATGWAMMVLGFVMIVPNGTIYSILGSDYCVQEYSVDYGSCRTDPTILRIGAVTMGTGAAFGYIGSRRVTIRPTRKGIGATATVRW